MTEPTNDFCRIVLEALPNGVYVVNREGKVILWSAGAEKLTGYLSQDVLGRLRETDLLEQPDEPNNSPEHLHSVTTPLTAPALTEVSIHCKDDRCLAGQLRSVALRNDSGKYLGMLRVFEADSLARLTNRRQDKLGPYGCLDPITGVLNHSMIQARLKESLTLHALYPVPFCVRSRRSAASPIGSCASPTPRWTPPNRRISLIVQYIEKKRADSSPSSQTGDQPAGPSKIPLPSAPLTSGSNPKK
jgi:PAS domain S-box-containing protein